MLLIIFLPLFLFLSLLCNSYPLCCCFQLLFFYTLLFMLYFSFWSHIILYSSGTFPSLRFSKITSFGSTCSTVCHFLFPLLLMLFFICPTFFHYSSLPSLFILFSFSRASIFWLDTSLSHSYSNSVCSTSIIFSSTPSSSPYSFSSLSLPNISLSYCISPSVPSLYSWSVSNSSSLPSYSSLLSQSCKSMSSMSVNSS